MVELMLKYIFQNIFFICTTIMYGFLGATLMWSTTGPIFMSGISLETFYSTGFFLFMDEKLTNLASITTLGIIFFQVSFYSCFCLSFIHCKMCESCDISS